MSRKYKFDNPEGIYIISFTTVSCEIYSNTIIDQKLDYLHNNPVVEGIVDQPEDYIYSSARDYCGQKGLLEIELLWI